MSPKTALMVEHAQNDYIHPSGSLSKGDQLHIVEHIITLIKSPGFSFRVLTESHFPQDSIFLCTSHEGREGGQTGNIPCPRTGAITEFELLPPNFSLRGSWGAQTVPGVDVGSFDLVLEKFTHKDHITISSFKDIHGNRHKDMSDGALSHDLEEELKRRGIEVVVLAGVHGDHCITQTALDLVGMGYAVYVVDDTVVFHDHGLDREKHWEGLRRKGVKVVKLEDRELQKLIGGK